MKIGSFEAQPAVPPAAADRKPAGAGAGNTAESSAKVELSSTAALLVQAAADPAFDAAKVDRIAGAIRDGKFHVNAEAIADKLIVNAEELLGRKQA